MPFSFFSACRQLCQTHTETRRHRQEANELADILHTATDEEAVSDFLVQLDRAIIEERITPSRNLVKAIIEKIADGDRNKAAMATAITIYQKDSSSFDWFFSGRMKGRKEVYKKKYYPDGVHYFLEQLTPHILSADRRDHAQYILSKVPELKKVYSYNSQSGYLTVSKTATAISESAITLAQNITSHYPVMITSSLVTCMAYQAVFSRQGHDVMPDHKSLAQVTLTSMLSHRPIYLVKAIRDIDVFTLNDSSKVSCRAFYNTLDAFVGVMIDAPRETKEQSAAEAYAAVARMKKCWDGDVPRDKEGQVLECVDGGPYADKILDRLAAEFPNAISSIDPARRIKPAMMRLRGVSPK